MSGFIRRFLILFFVFFVGATGDPVIYWSLLNPSKTKKLEKFTPFFCHEKGWCLLKVCSLNVDTEHDNIVCNCYHTDIKNHPMSKPSWIYTHVNICFELWLFVIQTPLLLLLLLLFHWNLSNPCGQIHPIPHISIAHKMAKFRDCSCSPTSMLASGCITYHNRHNL